MSARNPGFAEVIQLAIRQSSSALRVSMPGRIVKFYPATQTADVQPLITESSEDSSGEITESPIEIIQAVPVQFAGGGGFMITVPVAVNDPCWLTFSDRSIDRWFARGQLVDPVDVRRHHLSDAVAILGVRSKPEALAEFDTGRAVFGKVGGPRVAVDAASVQLGVTHGETATEPVIKGQSRVTAEQAYLGQVAALLGAVAAKLATAAASLTAAMVPNAIPIVGGALALPGFTALVAQLGAIAADVTAAATQVTTFQSRLPSDLSSVVKTK